ncbi:MAG TPA: hypothetical protein VLQ52_04125, partial [Coriobacteriia bacterium]|nr:hypothetical protein [Coriobacteriia bacterium]
MAVKRDTPPAPVSVTNDFAPGVRGFFQGARSLLTGIVITSKAVKNGPVTVRYPAEKLTVSDRWRGALALRGVLGRDEIHLLKAEPTEYNGIIDG